MLTPAVLELARAQHGAVARWQLPRHDIPASTLHSWLRVRQLERRGYAVYEVPGLSGPRLPLAVTVLGLGPHAVASHEAAGGVQGIVVDRAPMADVSVSAGHPRQRPNVVIHRVRLTARERTVCDGIPVTAPARTLLDLASRLTGRSIERAVARAFRLELTTPEERGSVVAQYPGRPGTASLAAMLAKEASPAFVRSEAEERFLTIVRESELPEPRVNARIQGCEVDFLWPVARLVAEIDGMTWHSSRAAQIRDRERDSRLIAAGYGVLRFTWADLTARPTVVVARVAMALSRRG